MSEIKKTSMDNASVAQDSSARGITTISGDDAGLAELGHAAQLKRQYGLVSVIALGCVATNSWSGLAGTLVAGVYSGGPPLIVFGYIFVTIANLFLALSLAELASSYPTTGGPYHYAAVLSPKRWSRMASFVTGYLNLFAWLVGTAGSVLVLGQFVMAMANLYNPNLVIERWMVFIAYQGWAIFSTSYTIFGNALMPYVIKFALFWTMMACIVSIIVMAAVSSPKQPASAVFATWINETGWKANAIAGCVGLINPAFGFAAIDATIHYAEEVRDPERNIPRSLIAVLAIGFVTGLGFLLSAFFSVSDYDAILGTATGLPIIELYRQATGTAGAWGLTMLVFFATIPSLLDCQTATSRLLWAFARDNALPFSKTLKVVKHETSVPVYASLAVGGIISLLGCIYIGNTTAFNAFISSGLVLNNLTYGIPIFINMLRGRKNFRRGKFQLTGMFGWLVNGLTCSWILFTVIFFEFPSFQPVTAANMNYTCLILGACLLTAGIYWRINAHKTYQGPVVEVILEGLEEDVARVRKVE